MKEGVITVSGAMLPSYAHKAEVVEQTLGAIDRAITTMATAERAGMLERAVEIPLI
jgi:hypothetical protein